MCRPVTCQTCSKTTWYGCGLHADQANRLILHLCSTPINDCLSYPGDGGSPRGRTVPRPRRTQRGSFIPAFEMHYNVALTFESCIRW
ncbi:hypothetical protein M407DRAFT_114449 [Tulasnella calospora MUT 4182]|uniref:Uncharacterized protein n=1 Tax=Tulasnella calospora MUT 4182 TaxID=1051891 RepID=A0A0C3QDN7_9AGAM|nr:hypothetical protein M407DRAFT_114449 [Tulasnella calospora MUT 4182]